MNISVCACVWEEVEDIHVSGDAGRQRGGGRIDVRRRMAPGRGIQRDEGRRDVNKT